MLDYSISEKVIASESTARMVKKLIIEEWFKESFRALFLFMEKKRNFFKKILDGKRSE